LLAIGASACGTKTPLPTARTTATTAKRIVAPWRPPGDLAALVGHHTITRAKVDHWIAVEAILSHEYDGDRPVPQGLVPDPPGYRKCVAFLTVHAGARRAAGTSKASLKRSCAQERARLRQQAMRLLIMHYWLSEEAARQSVLAPPEETRAVTMHTYPGESRHGFLASAGVRATDERLVVEDHLLLEGLQRRLPVFDVLRRSTTPESPQKVEEVELEEQRLNEEIARRWTPRTHCRAGYVVAECGEYVTRRE
jgi:hypothetical protein